MDVNFEKRLLRPTNPNIISPNGLTRASRNLFGRSPGEGGSSPSSIHSPTRMASPNASVSIVRNLTRGAIILILRLTSLIITHNFIPFFSHQCIEKILGCVEARLDLHCIVAQWQVQ